MTLAIFVFVDPRFVLAKIFDAVVSHRVTERSFVTRDVPKTVV